MSTFEYFAGQALAGLAANSQFAHPADAKLIANLAWSLAQEMMSYYPSNDEDRAGQ